MSYQILGYGYAWWADDPLPLLPPRAGFRVAPAEDEALIAELAQLDREEVAGRVDQAHYAYVAYLHDEPIAYGWSAAEIGTIAELDLVFAIPPGNRYLWDFATLPPWRGRGIYPRFLQAIINYEQPAAQHFWISHTAENYASRHGIIKAGFQMIEALVFTSAGALKVMPIDSSPRAELSPMGLRLGLQTP